LKTIIQKNFKNWKDCLSFIGFAYNRSVHCTKKNSPFEIIYGFNHLTLFDYCIYLLMKELVLMKEDSLLYVET
jgi:hypothetical protein